MSRLRDEELVLWLKAVLMIWCIDHLAFMIGSNMLYNQ